MKKVFTILLGLITPLVIFALWWYVTTFTDTPPTILPSISNTWDKFLELLDNGKLATNLSISLERVFKGYVTSVLIGIVFGTLLGMSSLARKILGPTFTTVRQIPIMAWIPLIILWCGIGESSKIVIIVLASVFPIMLNGHQILKLYDNEDGTLSARRKIPGNC